MFWQVWGLDFFCMGLVMSKFCFVEILSELTFFSLEKTPKIKKENQITESHTKCYTGSLLYSTLDAYKMLVLETLSKLLWK